MDKNNWKLLAVLQIIECLFSKFEGIFKFIKLANSKSEIHKFGIFDLCLPKPFPL